MPSAQSILFRYLADFATAMSDAVAHPPGGTAKSRAWNQADASIRLAQVEQARIQLGQRAGLLVGPMVTNAMKQGKRTAYFQAKNAGILSDEATQPQSDEGNSPASLRRSVASSLSGTFSRADTRAATVLAEDSAQDILRAARSTADRTVRAVKALAQRGVTNEEVNQILAQGILRGQRDEPVRQLRDILEKIHGKTLVIKDKNGDDREFDTKYYAEMVVRTRTREAEEEARHRQYQEFGCDLVVVVGPMSGDLCEEFVNKVFSLSGKDPNYPPLSSTPGGGPPFHPNCRHSTSLFVPQLATPEQIAAAKMGPDEQAAFLGKSQAGAYRAYKDMQLAAKNRDKDRQVKTSITGEDPGPVKRTFKKPDLRHPDPHKVDKSIVDSRKSEVKSTTNDRLPTTDSPKSGTGVSPGAMPPVSPASAAIGEAASIPEAIDHAKSLGIKSINIKPSAPEWGSSLPEVEALAKLNNINRWLNKLKNDYPKMARHHIDVLEVSSHDRGLAHIGTSTTHTDHHLAVSNPKTPAQQDVIASWERQQGVRLTAQRPTHWQEDNFRHELAHNLSTAAVQIAWQAATRGRGKDWFRKNVSDYATTNLYEEIAETFTLMTRPDYKRGTLPAEIERVIYSILGVQ